MQNFSIIEQMSELRSSLRGKVRVFNNLSSLTFFDLLIQVWMTNLSVTVRPMLEEAPVFTSINSLEQETVLCSSLFPAVYSDLVALASWLFHSQDNPFLNSGYFTLLSSMPLILFLFISAYLPNFLWVPAKIPYSAGNLSQSLFILVPLLFYVISYLPFHQLTLYYKV